MELESCPASVAIVATKDVRIELSTSKDALAHEGGYGLSPIGEFPDWKLEPEARRRAFDAVVQCVAREAPRSLLAADAADPAAAIVPRAGVPWLFFVATLLAVAGCVRRARATVAAIALVLATFLVRRWLQPFAFFHQNGQGPLWIEFAFRGDAGEYGPGYAELFGWASHVRRPEQGVALLQEALAATIPLSAWVLARGPGPGRAARSLGWVVAAALALDPVLVRIARSESYFSAIAALIFLAAAVLVATDLRHRAIGLVAASLLVAQAARVHPLAWAPCALVPLALFCRPGRPRERAMRTAVAALVIALIATPFVVPAMRASLHGRLGDFLPGAFAMLLQRGAIAGLFVALAAALAIIPATRRIGSRVLVVALVVATAALTEVLRADATVVRLADLHLFAPAAIAALGALRFRGAPVAVAASAVALLVVGRSQTTLPTDAREQAWALAWREQLPAGAEVASLSRAGQRVLALPLAGEGLPSWHRIDEHGVAHFGPGARFYYRSSLCSTPEGAPMCAAFEHAHALRIVETRRLPAIASLPWAPLPEGEIEVTLFRVE